MEKKILYDKYLCYNFDPLRICRLSLNKTSKMQIVSSSAAAALQRLFNKLKSVSKSNKVSYTNWMKPISINTRYIKCIFRAACTCLLPPATLSPKLFYPPHCRSQGLHLQPTQHCWRPGAQSDKEASTAGRDYHKLTKKRYCCHLHSSVHQDTPCCKHMSSVHSLNA